MNVAPYQPRYRLVSYYPFCWETNHYRGHVLEIGDGGVLVSASGCSPYALNGSYMLFVSVADAKLFVDALIAPPPRHAPTMHTEPAGEARIVLRRPRYQLVVDDPSRLWRGYAGKLVAPYRGYSLQVTGCGCLISHPEYGQYQIDGYYVIFQNEQAARDHIDSWFDNGHTISRV